MMTFKDNSGTHLVDLDYQDKIFCYIHDQLAAFCHEGEDPSQWDNWIIEADSLNEDERVVVQRLIAATWLAQSNAVSVFVKLTKRL